MADKVDKSLDDIIKDTKVGQRRGGGRGGRGGPRRGGAAGGQRFNRSFNNNPRRSGGGIQKRRSGGGAGNTSLSPTKAAASINGQWNHDLYQNGAGRFRRSASAGATGVAGPGPAKLVISNLEFGVNDSDIQGLFQEFGKIRKAAVHYDRTGRSLGTADVVFERKQDAIRALTHYNGVSLDGRPMNIQLTASLSAFSSAPGAGQRRSGGGAPGGQRRGGGFRRGVPGRGQRGSGGGGKRAPKSAADLDADLDAHNAKMITD